MAKIYKVTIVQKSPWLKELSSHVRFQIEIMLLRLKNSLEKAGLSLTLFERTWEPDSFVELLPKEYQHQLPFLYAHEFLYALDEVDKIMAVLENVNKMPDIPLSARNGIIQARVDFNNKIPGVNPVRNSAHHVEDRVRRKKTQEQNIILQPIQTPEISAPAGVLVVSDLYHNRLNYTAADGTLKEVEVSEATLKIVQETVQKVFDSFEWETIKW